MVKKRLIIFASGTKEGGGSGATNLVEASLDGRLPNAEIIAVVSNHGKGGVATHCKKLQVLFIHFAGPFDEIHYKKIIKETNPDFVALSGWLRPILGLDPKKTFNIHPGPLPRFGGIGMYGHYVHEAVIKAYNQGEVKNTEVSMHFVTPNYDEGPVFFRKAVSIMDDDTPETLAKRVNQAEHLWQPKITSLVLSGEISWDGKNPESIISPVEYTI
ncbi:MAG TPA: formyltransferase family protein [Candidatus Paceibacterota bacterium]